jgi:DNA helicase-2/ATP-dependent DNA helicase PcrA
MSRDYVLHPFQPPAELRIDYAGELNEQQLVAVTAPPGPALVIAGAGSGKTRTLTYRVAFLLEQGIPPDRILLLTFTNKAAHEMMRRVADLVGQELRALWGGTFHAIGNRVVRAHANLLGFNRNFSIMDREDARHLMSACLGDSAVDIKATRFPKPDVLCEILSLSLNTGRSLPEILGSDFSYFAHLAETIEKILSMYQTRKVAANTLDFDDLLVLWLKLMQQHPSICEHYQRRFQFVLVDEYQDTNRLQSEIVDLLAQRHKNVMVVGDDAQSIYSWRGANFQNILRFPERYPTAQVYKIETNYRSTPEILEAANASIRGNTQQFVKALAPARRSGIKPVVIVCGDAAVQAQFVAQRVLELRDEGAPLDQMAVLYRSHYHALELQLELTRRNIPFSITSGVRFFEQAHIKDITSYLKLVANPRDELAFTRIVQLLPGIGAKSASKLWKLFVAGDPEPKSAPPDQTGGAPPADPVVARAVQACSRSVPAKTQAAWAQLSATIAQLEAPDVRENASRMIQLVLEASYEDHLKASYANYRSRLEDLQQLAVFARQFTSVHDFLSQLALLTNVEADEDTPDAQDEERLRLSTIHQAKGLEFEIVFIIMLCEGMFPSSRTLDKPDTLEEERRLMYVSITRAKNELYLSYPLVHGGYSGGVVAQLPSRFLKEIPSELLDEWNLRPTYSY